MSSSLWILIATIAASLFFVAEAGLPTFGVAGTAGAACLAAAIFGITNSNDPWWPLLLVALGVVGAGVLLTKSSLEGPLPVIVAAMFLAGCVLYGITARDAATVGAGVIGAAGGAGAYVAIHRATRKLLDVKSTTGFADIVGKTAVVERWDRAGGAVRVNGTLWSATLSPAAGERPTAPPTMSIGQEVLVTDHEGLVLRITPKDRSS
jgi:membrane protein implicated in regulation of membrane protease activity